MPPSASPPVDSTVATAAARGRSSDPSRGGQPQTPPHNHQHQHQRQSALRHHPHQHGHPQQRLQDAQHSPPVPQFSPHRSSGSNLAASVHSPPQSTGRPPRPASAAGGQSPGAVTRGSASPGLFQQQTAQQTWTGGQDPSRHRPGSADDSGALLGGAASGGPGRREASSSALSPSLPPSNSSVPVGAAFAAVRAAATRSASAAQQALGPASAAAGHPRGSLTGGNPVAGPGSPGPGPASGVHVHDSPRRAAAASDGGRGRSGGTTGAASGTTGARGSAAGGGSGAAAAPKPGSSRGGGAGTGPAGGGGGGGDDVCGLPLDRQVAHYARQCAAAAEAGDAMRAAMAVHLLNGCFLRATGGFEGAVALAEAAAADAPGLVGGLVEAVSEGAPQSLVAFNALAYLALAPQVVPQLLSAGLVPVLVGQLRAASSAPLEQQLVVSALGLLVSMARVSREARAKLAGMRGVAGALAAALGQGALAVRRPALQLVQELIMTRKGLDQVRASSALMAALDRLCDDPGAPPGQQEQRQEEQQGEAGGAGGRPVGPGQGQHAASLQRQARSVRASIAALAAVMK